MKGLTCSQVASNVNVDPSNVQRTVGLFEEMGTVCSIQGYREDASKVLTSYDKFAILEAVIENPSLFLSVIQQMLLHKTGTRVSVPTICKYLQHAGFSKLVFKANREVTLFGNNSYRRLQCMIPACWCSLMNVDLIVNQHCGDMDMHLRLQECLLINIHENYR